MTSLKPPPRFIMLGTMRFMGIIIPIISAKRHSFMITKRVLYSTPNKFFKKKSIIISAGGY